MIEAACSPGCSFAEAGRMLVPGGKRYLAEFHRPEIALLRLLGWTYFKVFEPFGLALWTPTIRSAV